MVVTFEPEQIGEESVEVVAAGIGIDTTSAAVVDTGFAVMLVATSVAMATPSAAIEMVVEAADCKFFPLLPDFALCFCALFPTGFGEW